jgi:NSS family neurotransmitter:Na+ symporter
MSEKPRLALRDRWDSRTAFIFAAIGSAVGLGNLWRFPYIAASNGGGAFLVPFFVALLTAGIPLLILECGLGQMFQRGAPEALGRVRKGCEWVGWWALAVGSMISFYYAAVMAWSWDYLWYSLKALFSGKAVPWATDAQDFFETVVLSKSSGPWEFGGLSLPVVIGLVITWLAVFLIIHRGLKVVSKVVMVTVPLPVILLIALFVRTIYLNGAEAGLAYYLTPRFQELMKPSVWLAAYGQVFFSLSLGFGIMIAYASYQPRESDVTNDCLIISFGDAAVSFFAGFVVFTTLGYLAAESVAATTVPDVVGAGPSLTFITYPKAIALMPWASFVGVLFFLALLTLGIDSLFSIVEAIITGIEDKWPIGRDKITALFCGGGLLIGLVYATHAGYHWLGIVDGWMSDFGLAAVGLVECVVVGWFYKTGQLRRWLNSVSEVRVGFWWDACIKLITPGILVVVMVLTIIGLVRQMFDPAKPRLAIFVGALLSVGVIVLGVVVARIPGKLVPAEKPEATTEIEET